MTTSEGMESRSGTSCWQLDYARIYYSAAEMNF